MKHDNEIPLFSVTKKDFEITYFNGTGKGGQHRNKHANCVRMKHVPTGVMTTGQDQRSLKQNERSAFLRMTQNKKFMAWVKLEAQRRLTSSIEIEKKVERAMQLENLKIETF